jgi:hypothetical protein
MIEAHGLVKRYGSTMAAGTLLRHPAAAIASMIAVLFVLPELRPPGSRRSVIPGSTAIRRPRRLDNRRTNPGWTNANEVQDLDNLIKPALDAMEGIFGLRTWKGPVQAADDRADRLEAVRRLPRQGEPAGATIDVRVIVPD